MVEQAAERYCRPPQRITFKAYRLEGSVRVIVAEIAASDVRPVSVDEGAGLLKAYYRVADENIAATPMMMRAWQLASDPEAAPLDSRPLQPRPQSSTASMCASTSSRYL